MNAVAAKRASDATAGCAAEVAAANEAIETCRRMIPRLALTFRDDVGGIDAPAFGVTNALGNLLGAVLGASNEEAAGRELWRAYGTFAGRANSTIWRRWYSRILVRARAAWRRRRAHSAGSGPKPGRRSDLALQSSGIIDASAIAKAAGFAILSRFGRFIPAAIHWSISTKSSSISVSDSTFLSTRPCA